jgi:hypothetical protein
LVATYGAGLRLVSPSALASGLALPSTILSLPPLSDSRTLDRPRAAVVFDAGEARGDPGYIDPHNPMRYTLPGTFAARTLLLQPGSERKSRWANWAGRRTSPALLRLGPIGQGLCSDASAGEGPPARVRRRGSSPVREKVEVLYGVPRALTRLSYFNFSIHPPGMVPASEHLAEEASR